MSMRQSFTKLTKSLASWVFLATLVLLPRASHAAYDCRSVFTAAGARLRYAFSNQSIEALEREKTKLKNDYHLHRHIIATETSVFDVEKSISLAHRAQIRYCEAHNEIVRQTRKGFFVEPLARKYIGEEYAKSKAHDALRFNGDPQSETPVDYFTPAELAAAKVTLQEGRFYNSMGSPIIDVANRIFVMDENGEIYIMTTAQAEKKTFKHHTSLSNGDPVAAAGKISIGRHGRVSTSKRTGHYLTNNFFFKQFLDRLELAGFHATRIQIYPPDLKDIPAASDAP